MTKRSALMLFATLTLALWGCNQLPDPEPGNRQSREITLSGGIGAYTKVANNAFEAGDKLGLFAAAPVDASNVLITSDGNGAFTPSQKLYWGDYQEDNDTTRFIAYYPYAQNASLQAPLSFNISSEQNRNYSEADFLYAKVDATPADGGVNFLFKHILSRMVITVDCLVEGDYVTSVRIDGVQLGANIDLATGKAEAVGELIPAMAAQMDNGFAAVVAPQTAQPDLILELFSGESIWFHPAETLKFEAGKQVRAHLVIDAAKECSFTADIEDWVSEELEFQGEIPGGQQGAEESWYAYLLESGSYVPLEATEDGLLQARLYGYFGEGFFLVSMNESSTRCLGQIYKDYAYAGDAEDIKLMSTYDTGYAIMVDTDLDITVSFDKAAMTLSLAEVPYDWESLGMGKFIDGFIAGLFNGLPLDESNVEILSSPNYENLYGINNPYADARFVEEVGFKLSPTVLQFVITEADSVYFKTSPLGLSYGRYGDFYGFSPVPANGWDMDCYGILDRQNNFIDFPDITATLCEMGLYVSNRQRMMSITMPGGKRPYLYYNIKDLYYGIEDGNVVLGGTPELDVADVYYTVYYGTLEGDDLNAAISRVAAIGNSVDRFERGYFFEAHWPIEEAGDFTAVYVGINDSGDAVSSAYQYFSAAPERDLYEAWIGTWEMLAYDGNTYKYEIKEENAGFSYIMDGFTFPVHIYYDSGDLVFYSGETVGEYSGYTGYTMGMGDNDIYADETESIARFIMSEDLMSATIKPIIGDLDSFGVIAVNNSNGNLSLFSYSDIIEMPQTITKVQDGSYGAPARRMARGSLNLSDELILKKK